MVVSIEPSLLTGIHSAGRAKARGRNGPRWHRFLRWRCAICSPRDQAMRFVVGDRLSLPLW